MNSGEIRPRLDHTKALYLFYVPTRLEEPPFINEKRAVSQIYLHNVNHSVDTIMCL